LLWCSYAGLQTAIVASGIGYAIVTLLLVISPSGRTIRVAPPKSDHATEVTEPIAEPA
jgi:hypothetical protein